MHCLLPPLLSAWRAGAIVTLTWCGICRVLKEQVGPGGDWELPVDTMKLGFEALSQAKLDICCPHPEKWHRVHKSRGRAFKTSGPVRPCTAWWRSLRLMLEKQEKVGSRKDKEKASIRKSWSPVWKLL